VWTDTGTVIHTIRQSYSCVDRDSDTSIRQSYRCVDKHRDNDTSIRQSYRCVDRQKDTDNHIQVVIHVCRQSDEH